MLSQMKPLQETIGPTDTPPTTFNLMQDPKKNQFSLPPLYPVFAKLMVRQFACRLKQRDRNQSDLYDWRFLINDSINFLRSK